MDVLIWKDSSAEFFQTTDQEVISGKPQINHVESIQVAGGMKDFLIAKTSLLDDNDKLVGIIGCNIFVRIYFAKKESYFNLEEQCFCLNSSCRRLDKKKCKEVGDGVLHRPFTKKYIQIIINFR